MTDHVYILNIPEIKLLLNFLHQEANKDVPFALSKAPPQPVLYEEAVEILYSFVSGEDFDTHLCHVEILAEMAYSVIKQLRRFIELTQSIYLTILDNYGNIAIIF